MKIAAIPDPHGSHHWEATAADIDMYDKIVFLGDYFDNWENQWPDQMNNFKSIIAFKLLHLDKVEILIGNHDNAYLIDEPCSGHQKLHAYDIREAIKEYKEVINAVWVHEKTIFSHAGVSRYWLEEDDFELMDLNRLWHFDPQSFDWIGPNAYGDNIKEGPLWIRPNSLKKSHIKGYNQVVGHTEISEYTEVETALVDGDQLYFVDSRRHDKVLVLDI